MGDNDKLKIAIDKLYDIDVNINLIYEKLAKILEIMENMQRDNYEN